MRALLAILPTWQKLDTAPPCGAARRYQWRHQGADGHLRRMGDRARVVQGTWKARSAGPHATVSPICFLSRPHCPHQTALPLLPLAMALGTQSSLAPE